MLTALHAEFETTVASQKQYLSSWDFVSAQPPKAAMTIVEIAWQTTPSNTRDVAQSHVELH